MKSIPLINKYHQIVGYALISDEDVELVSQYNWHLRTDGYACTKISGQLILMHRFINNTPAGLMTDHINRCRLDNTRSNLRSVTAAENNRNRTKKKSAATSKYKGVSKDKNRYRSRIYVNGRNLAIGNYRSEIEAAKAYDEAAVQYYGEYASLNFPEDYAC